MSDEASHRPSEVFAALQRLGFGVAVTIPDSWLGGLLVEMDRADWITLIRATHEEEALAIACGARLGGARAAMIVQNAGLLSVGAGMVCLAQRYRFPLLILASHRGTADDPIFFHIPKGRATEPVLQGLGLAYGVTDRHRPIGPQVEAAATYAEESSSPYVLLMSREDVQW